MGLFGKKKKDEENEEEDNFWTKDANRVNAGHPTIPEAVQEQIQPKRCWCGRSVRFSSLIVFDEDGNPLCKKHGG